MTEPKICCICGQLFSGWGNNPWPVADKGECCSICNLTTVIPARFEQMKKEETTSEE